MLGKHLVFLDSFQYMASSLERLADDLPADKFNYTSHAFKGEKLAVMKKKGGYHMIIWKVVRSLATNNYPQMRNFIVFLKMRASVNSNTNMLKKFEIHLG